MVEAHGTRVLGARFEFVARLRPDQRYATPLPHVRELLHAVRRWTLAEDARGANLDLVTWDDQVFVATRTAGLRWMSVVPLAARARSSGRRRATQWGGRPARRRRGRRRVRRPRLSFVIAPLLSGARDCGYPWGARAAA